MSNVGNSKRGHSALRLAKLSANHPMFKLGYYSAINGLPFDYTLESKRDSICYTRGRQFAILTGINKYPKAIWRKDIPAKTLIDRLDMCLSDSSII